MQSVKKFMIRFASLYSLNNQSIGNPLKRLKIFTERTLQAKSYSQEFGKQQVTKGTQKPPQPSANTTNSSSSQRPSDFSFILKETLFTAGVRI
jgi:hypothetical protein